MDANSARAAVGDPTSTSAYIPGGMPAALQIGLLCRTVGIARGIVQGSSTVEGANAVPRTERWTNRVEKMLQASFNPIGINGGYSLRGNDPSPIWVKTGTTNDQKAVGLGVRCLEMAVGATATHSAAVADGFTLTFIPGATYGGVVDISVDGGAALRFSPKNSSTGEWKSGVLARGAHSIKITAVETANLEFAYVHDGDHAFGLQLLSAGVSGATAGNYANDANTEHWARITRMASTVFCAPIMIGSNDAMAQVPLATFKTNILGMIQKTHAALGKSVWTPLIGMPARPDTPLTIPNSSYIAVLKQVADENPQWCTFHDLSGYFPTTQSADTLNLMDADNTHPTTMGHAYEADLLAQMWGIPIRPSGKALPPAVGTGGTGAETATVTSVAGTEPIRLALDKFDRANANTLGTASTGQAWQVGASSWRINNNAAQGLGYAVLDVGTTNYDASAVFTFDTLSGVAGIPLKYIDDSNRITAYFDYGVLRLAKTEAGILTLLAPDTSYVRTVGTTCTLRVTYVNGVVTTYIDSVQKQTVTLTGPDLTKFGPVTKVGLRQNEYNAHIDNFQVI